MLSFGRAAVTAKKVNGPSGLLDHGMQSRTVVGQWEGGFGRQISVSRRSRLERLRYEGGGHREGELPVSQRQEHAQVGAYIRRKLSACLGSWQRVPSSRNPCLGFCHGVTDLISGDISPKCENGILRPVVGRGYVVASKKLGRIERGMGFKNLERERKS
jgi:hypothetical protein